MKYRLGLDVGTASLGLVAYELDDQGRPVSIPYHSVRIFSEPLLPPAKGAGIGELKQAARRKTRQQMRLHQRRARRLRKLAHLAPLLGIDPEAVARRRKPHILEVRARAATEKVDLEDLLRIFLHLSKRRGYAGIFRARKGGDMGQVQTGIGDIRKKMDEAGCETLGEYLWHRHRQGQDLRLKGHGLYADREMIFNEFDRIWTRQEREHKQLCGEHKGRSLRKTFEEAIFYQRPIRILSAGNCELETSLPRSPLVQPACQEFRIEKQIADLRWAKKGRRHPKPLEEPAKQVIRKLLSENERVKFEEIYKALEKTGIPPAPDEYLNLSEGGREDLHGNVTNACMKKLGLESEWQSLTDGHQIAALNLLANTGSPDIFYARNWHENIPKGKKRADGTPEYRCIPGKVVNFINSLAQMEKLDWLSNMGFDSGRSAYSIKALRRLATAMREKGLDETDAISLLYPQVANAAMREELLGELPPHQHTGNVVVDVSLRQVRREVNATIRKLGGPPDSVIIELAREMPLGVKRRGEIAEQNKKNQKDRKNAKKVIEAHTGRTASERAITRYLLWSEQDKQWCPYCTSEISLDNVLDGSTQREHIFPRSVTHIGKRRDYLVLAHRSCNYEKGAQTPWEKWGDDPERWKLIKEQAGRFGARAKELKKLADRFEKKRMLGKMRQLLSKKSSESLLDSEEIGDFSARQLQDTSWIAKNCAQWMGMICSNVAVSRGILTESLRRKWGLDTVIPEVRLEKKLPVFDREEQLITPEDFERHRAYWEEGGEEGDSGKTHRRIDKRTDHRHHLIDAMVIGLISRGLYQKMAQAYKREAEKMASPADRRRIPLRAKPPIPGIRNLALEIVRNCNLTHKRDRWPAGPLFDLNPVSVYEVQVSGNWKLTKLAKNLSGKVSEDIEQRAKDREAGLNQISKIADKAIREIVRQVYEERIDSGASPKRALSKLILDREGNQIQQVRVSYKEKRFSQRWELTKLAEKLSDKVSDNPEKRAKDLAAGLKQINKIANPSTREIVERAYEERIATGKSPKQALSMPILDMRFNKRFGTQIRRVLVKYDEKAKGQITVKHGRNGELKKYLKTEGYAWLEWDAQKGEARLVTLYEAMKSGRSEAPKGVRFFKGDTVLNTSDQKRYVVCQIWAENGGSLVLILHTETRGAKLTGSDSGKKRVSGRNLSKLTLISDDWPPHSSD